MAVSLNGDNERLSGDERLGCLQAIGGKDSFRGQAVQLRQTLQGVPSFDGIDQHHLSPPLFIRILLLLSYSATPPT
ncbi:hypothetical protein D3C84_1009530 [compost metagenome]